MLSIQLYFTRKRFPWVTTGTRSSHPTIGARAEHPVSSKPLQQRHRKVFEQLGQRQPDHAIALGDLLDAIGEDVAVALAGRGVWQRQQRTSPGWAAQRKHISLAQAFRQQARRDNQRLFANWRG